MVVVSGIATHERKSARHLEQLVNDDVAAGLPRSPHGEGVVEFVAVFDKLVLEVEVDKF